MTNGYYVLAKLIQITSVILNTLSIFYAQFVQINHKNQQQKITGLNMWYIIEVLTFYMYLLSAMGFIAKTQILRSCGKQQQYDDRYKYGFLRFHQIQLKWLSLLMILVMVSLSIMIIDWSNLQYDAVNKSTSL